MKTLSFEEHHSSLVGGIKGSAKTFVLTPSCTCIYVRMWVWVWVYVYIYFQHVQGSNGKTYLQLAASTQICLKGKL